MAKSMSVNTNSWQLRKTKPVNMPMQIVMSMILGPSTCGLGISSIIWIVASKPVRANAPCSSPRSHATPSGQPVRLIKSPYTNFPDWKVGDAHARTVMLMIAKPLSDQKKALLVNRGSNRLAKVLMRKAARTYAS